MISIEKLRQIKHGIFHSSCPDGVASALIVKDALPDVRVSFVKYGTEEHKSIEPAPGTLFCDFSPWLPAVGSGDTSSDRRAALIKDWNDAGVVVLDHHSRDVVEPYGELGVFGENEWLECGAMLAFEHVWLPLREESGLDANGYVRRIAELAAVRDTWQRNDPRWQEACEQASVMVFFAFEDLTLFSFESGEDYSLIAKTLVNRQLSAARTAVSEAHRFSTKRGTRVLAFQGVSATSDAAELLERAERGADEQLSGGALEVAHTDLVVGFHYRADAGKLQLQFSTRSHTGFDCQALARAHGGNGHRAAAGFTVEVSPEIGGNPFAVFRLLLEEWEGGQ